MRSPTRSSSLPEGPVDGQAMHLGPAATPPPPRRRHGERARASARALRAPAAACACMISAGEDRRRRCDPARDRAPAAQSRPSGPDDAIPAIAAKPRAMRFRPDRGGSPHGRNTRATPPARLRDYRHRARDRDRARVLRPCSAGTPAREHERSGGASRSCCARDAAPAAAPPAWSGSSRRTRHGRAMICVAARTSARRSTP